MGMEWAARVKPRGRARVRRTGRSLIGAGELSRRTQHVSELRTVLPEAEHVDGSAVVEAGAGAKQPRVRIAASEVSESIRTIL